MVGVLLFLVFVGLALRIHYGLSRPHFWVFAGVVLLIGLPVVIGLALLAPMVLLIGAR